MKTNKLKENMRRFGTKNLNKLTEQRNYKEGIKIDPVVKAFDGVLKQQGFTFDFFDHPWDVYTYHNSEGLLTLICYVDWETDSARKRVRPSESDAVVKIVPVADISQREIDPNKFRQYMDPGTSTYGHDGKIFQMDHQAIEFTIPYDNFLINKKAKLKSQLQKMIAKYGKANKL